MPIATCLPSGSNFGWGICGDRLTKELASYGGVSVRPNGDPISLPLLMAVTGATFAPLGPIKTTGKRVGLAFIESPSEARPFVDVCNREYDVLVCGSQWMADEMRRIGVRKTEVVLQGVDFEMFKVPTKAKPKQHTFTVFSGGKIEYRKGHDLVIAAMAQFMKEHDDVRLVTSWANQWPVTMRSIVQSRFIKPVNLSGDWYGDSERLMRKNGIPTDRVYLIPLLHQADMVEFYQECDVGLFMNRCEAGNNMVMSEAIACGLPVISNDSTGHWDVFSRIEPWGKKVECPTDFHVDQWWEPTNIDDVLACLEYCYARKQNLEEEGRYAAATMRRNYPSWEQSASRLMGILRS